MSDTVKTTQLIVDQMKASLEHLPTEAQSEPMFEGMSFNDIVNHVQRKTDLGEQIIEKWNSLDAVPL